jgi:hypothetical protein
VLVVNLAACSVFVWTPVNVGRLCLVVAFHTTFFLPFALGEIGEILFFPLGILILPACVFLKQWLNRLLFNILPPPKPTSPGRGELEY